MKKYNVYWTEYSYGCAEIEADSFKEACKKLDADIYNGRYVLQEHVDSSEFSIDTTANDIEEE